MAVIPNFLDVSNYYQRRGDIELWRPALEAVMSEHGLSCASITASPGSNPVFKLDDERIVKFFTPFFDGAHYFATEISALERTAIVGMPSPRLLARGLMRDTAGRKWPYIITDVIKGAPLEESWMLLDAHARRAVAADLGKMLSKLHRAPLGASEREEFRTFCAHMARTALRRHTDAGCAPPWALDTLQEQAFEIDNLWDDDDIVFIHADLTPRHIFGHFDGTSFEISGLVDFGDARAEHLLYELIPLHLATFGGDKACLDAFFQAYSSPKPAHLSRLALPFFLLYEFSAFHFLANHGALESIHSLEQLCTRLWGGRTTHHNQP